MHHPPAIYAISENFLKRSILTEFNTIPTMVTAHSIPNITQPSGPRRVLSAMGVYVPAIRMNIDVWSNMRKTNFAFSFVKA